MVLFFFTVFCLSIVIGRTSNKNLVSGIVGRWDIFEFCY